MNKLNKETKMTKSISRKITISNLEWAFISLFFFAAALKKTVLGPENLRFGEELPQNGMEWIYCKSQIRILGTRKTGRA